MSTFFNLWSLTGVNGAMVTEIMLYCDLHALHQTGHHQMLQHMVWSLQSQKLWGPDQPLTKLYKERTKWYFSIQQNGICPSFLFHKINIYFTWNRFTVWPHRNLHMKSAVPHIRNGTDRLDHMTNHIDYGQIDDGSVNRKKIL